MEIAIIGAGNVGKALAKASVELGHGVTITAAHIENAQAAADEVGARSAKSNAEAVENADVVILAVPVGAVDEVLRETGESLSGKVVVDTTNRVDMSDFAAKLDGTSAAEDIQAKAPGARVVKALNTAFAAHMADPKVDGTEIDGFIAGDDQEAKNTVAELLRGIGFRPIDAGSLAMARALEALGTLNIALNAQHGWSWQTEWKLLGPLG